jgi:signal transduction histidine kinase
MRLFSTVARVFLYSGGAGLTVLLLWTALAKGPRDARSRILSAALALAVVWYGSQAALLWAGAVLEEGQGHGLRATLGVALEWSALLFPALLLHLALAWSGASSWFALPAYAAAAGVGVADRDDAVLTQALTGVCLVASGCLALVAAARASATTRRFLRAFACVMFAVAVALWFTGRDSASFALASIAPPAVFAWFIYKYNVFDYVVTRRSAFVLGLALFSSAYLLMARALARVVEDAFAVYGRVVEVSLILAVAILWVPLYQWITRFFTRRTERYADFCREVIDRAVPMLDVRERIRFLAREVGRVFGFRRVLLYRPGPPAYVEMHGGEPDATLLEVTRLLFDSAGRTRIEFFHVLRPDSASVRDVLESQGFHYAIPLWYEERLMGLMLVDVSPVRTLDENEPILLGLCRQVAHSIESCRLVEQKISLEKALAKQEQLAALGLAAAAIAHEVKNPLSSIKTLAQLMREDKAIAEVYERDLAYIVAETDRLNTFVRHLLDYARPSAETAMTSLPELLEAAVPVLKRVCADRHVAIECTADPALRELRVRKHAIQHVVTNLMQNAIEASPDNSTVRVEAAREGRNGIRLVVSDSGPGIQKELREKIFEPFFTTKPAGTGLGLPIVRKYVEEMGGLIRIESPANDGRGATFVVTLPAAPGDAQ